MSSDSTFGRSRGYGSHSPNLSSVPRSVRYTPSVCPPWCARVVNTSAVRASRTTSPMTTTTLPRLVPPPPLMRCKSYFHHKNIIRFLPIYHSHREEIRRQRSSRSRGDVMSYRRLKMLFPFPNKVYLLDRATRKRPALALFSTL
jgi:hypothetical protein